MQPQADVRKVEKTIPELYVQNYKYGASQKLQVKLQPLNDLYFHSEHIASNEWWGYIPQGSPQLTLILCIVTFIILLLVTCNFLMIKIARLSKEFAGLAVQKCYGASNRTLQMQFLLETGVQVIIALVIAIIATYILHPRFIEIISPKQLYPLHLSIADIAFFAILVLLLIVGIGGSLCFYITRYLNRNSVKEVIQKKAGYFDLKKILAVTQMCIFCTLLFCSAILIRQMDFIRTKDLGMNSHNVIAFTVWANNFETLKAEFGNDPSIELVSIGSSIPENESWTTEYAFPEQPDEKFKSSILMGDADFIRIHQIELTEGENIHEETYLRQQKEVNEYYHRQNEAQKAGIPFEEKEPSYEVEALVNQQFVKEHRLTHPVGTLIKVNDLNYRIIGVTGNFHYLPLYNNIEPLIICYNGGFNDQRIKVRYREGCREQALSHLKKVHETLPVRENEFGFEEYQYSDFYDKDITFIKMINIFTILSVFIGGMGIFAFSVFLAENKKKEIALRKINGATEWQVMSLLNRSFIYRTVISCAIGIPIAYFLMQKWLEGYAYKTPLSGWIFIAVVMACVALVAFIISWQTWNAATQNPAESIKSE